MSKQYMRCPRCGKLTENVEVIYPRTDEQEERRVKAFMCPHCRYLFSKPDIENDNHSFQNETEYN